jgi:hypothetical protein
MSRLVRCPTTASQLLRTKTRLWTWSRSSYLCACIAKPRKGVECQDWVLEGMHRVSSGTNLDNLGHCHAAVAWRGSQYILNCHCSKSTLSTAGANACRSVSFIASIGSCQPATFRGWSVTSSSNLRIVILLIDYDVEDAVGDSRKSVHDIDSFEAQHRDA